MGTFAIHSRIPYLRAWWWITSRGGPSSTEFDPTSYLLSNSRTTNWATGQEQGNNGGFHLHMPNFLLLLLLGCMGFFLPAIESNRPNPRPLGLVHSIAIVDNKKIPNHCLCIQPLSFPRTHLSLYVRHYSIPQVRLKVFLIQELTWKDELDRSTCGYPTFMRSHADGAQALGP